MIRFSVTGADGYERGIGRWSRRLVPAFLDFSGNVAGRVLDIGCGTGILAEALLGRRDVMGVVGIDINEALLERARAAVVDPRASFDRVDASRLPYADASFDHALSLLVVNFLERREASVQEAMRVTRPGGTVAAAVWDFRGGFVYTRFAWDVVAALDPAAAPERDKLLQSPFLRPGSLAALWRQCGLVDVRDASLTIDMTFANFDDYWLPLLAAGQPFSRFFATLSANAQSRTQDAVRAAFLGGDEDGPRSFVARAFAVGGHVPSRGDGNA